MAEPEALAELKTYKGQFHAFIDATQDNRRLAERDRDYIDHKQWTSAEAQVLRGRKQAPVVINRIKPKHDFLIGLERQSRTDPKAFPRTPEHEADADAMTDALRFVAQNSDFDQTASDVFDYTSAEGYAGVIVEVDKNQEIIPRLVSWDRFYYDPHSRRRDFKDASFMGITTWLYEDELVMMFPDMEDEIRSAGKSFSIDETFDDKPLWIDKAHSKRTRRRVNEHYFKRMGVWHLVFFTGDLILQEPKGSPYLTYEHEKEGEPTCPIEAESAYVDRDNNRYGVVRGLIHIQDEINHRRSKALHALSNVTVIRGPGVVESGDRLMNQLASGKADIELLNNDGRFEIDRNAELGSSQLALMGEAKTEIDNVGVNATLAGKDERSLSGRAIQAKQEGGVVELRVLFDTHNHWKQRVYRQIWDRIKQFWTAERWVRVTDDESNVRFVGLNREITGRDVIAEQLGVPPQEVEMALQRQGVAILPADLDRTVRVENEVAQMDVDVVIAEVPDMVTIQQEQFQILANLAQTYGPQAVPFEEVVRLSGLRNKDEYLERTQGDEDQRQAILAQQIQQDQAESEADIRKTQSETAKNLGAAQKSFAEAEQQRVETRLAQFGLEEL